MNDPVKEQKTNSTQSNQPAPQRTGNQYPQGCKTDPWQVNDAPNAQSSSSQSHSEQILGGQPSSAQQHQAQQPSGMVNAAVIKARWKHMLNSARKTWCNLTDVEIVKTGGDEQKLTGLVKEGYAIPREEANKPAKSSFAKNTDK